MTTTPEDGDAHASIPAASSAAGIVTALWDAAPLVTALDVTGLDETLRKIAAHLAHVAKAARLLESSTATPDVRRGATLLAETADVLYDAITDPKAEHWHRSAHSALPWPVRLRLSRLERWLTARSSTEPEATAAADLCLWLAEQLEATTH
ncbi:MAG: hypothetical protein ACXWZS_00270 [Gemmatirosa sp.]